MVVGLIGCGDSDQAGPGRLSGATFRVSECGGFSASATSSSSPSRYCDAEVLDWRYDNAKQQLTLVDKRAVLNCCGDHSQTVSEENGVIVVRQTDAPQGGSGRCLCECVYDFEAVIPAVLGPLRVRIERVVTDATNPKPRVLFDGTLDLSVGAGRETIDPSPTPFCDKGQTPTPLPFKAAVSECGGFASAKPGDTPAPLPMPLPPTPADYCKAEVLAWSHNAASGQLQLRDNRVLLNCCGDRTLKATMVNGVYILRETDGPEGGKAGMRCNCLCVFDFDMTLEKVTGASVSIELRREVLDDNAGEQLVWSGKLDLSAGSGQIVVDSSDVSGFCHP
ncbi:MAG: hypothetical protein CSA24_00450 [Deltaproteobacteria bacterium]|nr:MAG: hypothetical protein CSB49_00530 [Pseudomonadota bacterium]PIE66311.1 MAG: hypothetical protein CSA24_00450 [Deltaproteobacteria bacterium]